jgi:hypothetical protein
MKANVLELFIASLYSSSLRMDVIIDDIFIWNDSTNVRTLLINARSALSHSIIYLRSFNVYLSCKMIL